MGVNEGRLQALFSNSPAERMNLQWKGFIRVATEQNLDT